MSGGPAGASALPRLRFGCGLLLLGVLAARAVWAVAGAEPIVTVAGGWGIGDGGPAALASLDSPKGLAMDPAGNLYIADSGHDRVRKIDPHGLISTVAGDGSPPDGLGDGGPATAASLHRPSGVALDGAGNLYIADTGNHRIRKVDSRGVITAVAGNGVPGFGGDNGPAIGASLDEPAGVAVDGTGTLYIADSANHRVRKVDAGGIITTVAGNGLRGTDGDGGPAIAATLDTPVDVALDGSGRLLIVDQSHVSVSPLFNVTLSVDARIRRLDSAGIITTVAGNGQADYGGDGGPAAAASLSNPQGVSVDRAGNLYIADSGNHRVRRVLNAEGAANRHSLLVSRTPGGRVTGNPRGIDCGAACIHGFNPGTRVVLTAKAAAGYRFTGWGGACRGTGKCKVTMDRFRTVSAAFAPKASRFPLAVSQPGSGKGRVTSVPAGIRCGRHCEAAYRAGKTVRLTAKADTGSIFAGWSGDCQGNGRRRVTVDRALWVGARFERRKTGQ